ncbi:hypothetical protein ES708_12811 [subsurface metagenome]
MGWGRVIGSGCLGMLCLIPMAYISFSLLDLTSSVTGGLITNLNDAIASIGGLLGSELGPVAGILSFFASAFLGLILILLFPIHWCIFYKPDDVLLLISVVLPWILCCTISSAIFAHSPRGGIHTSLAIGIGYLIPAMVIYLAISLIPGGYGSLIGGVVDGAVSGLTDLPYLLAVFTAILEGCLVGAVFGGFIGSLKYKPTEGTARLKARKSKGKAEEVQEPSLDSSELCPNCKAKLVPGNEFCTNCGSAIEVK